MCLAGLLHRDDIEPRIIGNMPRPSRTAIDALDRYVGQAVRERRLASGMTQAALAEAIDVTFQQLQKYEGGTTRIAASRLIRISRALRCKLVDLVPEEDR